MAAKRIRWTDSDKALLVTECFKVVSTLVGTRMEDLSAEEVLNVRNFFSTIFTTAQKIAFKDDPSKVRKISAHSEVPWLKQAIRDEAQRIEHEHLSILAERHEEQQHVVNPYEAAFKPLIDLLVPLLADRLAEAVAAKVAELKPHQPSHRTKHNPEPESDRPATRLPFAVVLGLLGQQQQEIAKQFSELYQLKFIDKNLKSIDQAVHHADVAFCLIGKTSHAMTNTLSRVEKQMGMRYIPVRGALSSLRVAMQQYLDQHGETK